MYKLKSTKPAIDLDTDWIQKGKKCWVFNPMDDLIIFMKAKVVQFKPATYTPSASTVLCEFEGSNKLEIPVVEVFQRNQFTSILTNLTDLEVINNPEILFQLNERFKQKKIFTFIGSNLLIINPYQLIAHVFNQEMIDYYYNAIFVEKMTYKDQEPHIYGMTSEILKNISLEKEDQVIIISGESGSGKTETNKFCLKYLTKVCHKFVKANYEQVQDIENKILNCNPLLEAFGNAKTVKNDNSSRFGKLTALKIHSSNFYIKEAFIRSYFLEKSRVTLKNANELNFHIFYYIIDGIPPEERSKYHLENPDRSAMTINHFEYTKTRETLDQYKNLKCFNEVVASMKVLGLGDSNEETWRLVMGILHLGNLSFDETTYSEQKGGSPCSVADNKNLKSICDLLGVVPSDLEKSIVFYKRKTAQQEFYSPQNKRKCEQTRDSISKMIYQSLFLWIIDRLNRTLCVSKSQQEPNFYYLKLLDIYGFQVFDENGYEQLAVNYTNQRLHQIYIHQVFKQEKEAFREEGIGDAIINLKFADNTGVIELIDLSPTSIYNLVDQSCTVETKDDVLLSNIKKTHLEKSPEYFPPDANKNLIRRSFIINHTPGQIQYNILGFREKNKDFVREDIIELLSYSTNTILNQMFKEQQKLLLENKAKRFLSQKLRQEINSLMGELEAGTHVHFVRCIKPNDYKQPFVFVPKMALNQIKYLGLLDTILLRRATYHIKMPYENFYKLYSSIDFTDSNNLTFRERAQQLFKKHFMGRGVDYIFGSTKIFLKEDSKPMIDKLYNQKLKRITEYSRVVESYLSFSKLMSVYTKKKERYDNLNLLEVYISNFSFEVKRHEAARRLQRWWTITINEHVNKRKRKVCITVQKYFRRFLYSLNYNATQNNVSVIEKYFHGHVKARLQEQMVWFRREAMDEILDLIWDKAIQLKTETIAKYLSHMMNRIRQKGSLQIINRNYKERMSKRVTKSLLIYLESFLPAIRHERYLKALTYIQRTFRFLKIRKYFTAAKKSVRMIQRNWRQYHIQKLENIKFYQKVFESENRNRVQSMKVANEVFFKSKKLKNNTVELLLGELENSKANKIYLFYYLLDYQLLVDTSLVYSDNSWVNNYYTLFRDSLQRGNPVQMVALGETHTVVSSTNKIYSWGWNDYHQLGVNDKSIHPHVINCLNLPSTAKPQSIKAFNNYSSISFSDPPCIHYFGKIEEEREILNSQFVSTITKKYAIINGQIHQIVGKIYKEIPLQQKISSISCGALHVAAKSHLKRMLSWGNNDKGQLGHGDYISKDNPTLIVFEVDTKQNKPIQVSAGYSSTLILLSNHKMYWCGTTSKINRVNYPTEIELDKQSSFIWDQARYTPVRVASSWSRSMSIHGVTLAFHHGVLSTNIALKKKVLSMLAAKWSESDCNSLLPPYIPSITKYFTQKTMRMPNYQPETQMQSRKKLKQLREAIEVQLDSFRVTNSDTLSQTYQDKQFQYD